MSLSRIHNLMAEAGIQAALIADIANIFYLTRKVFRGYIYIAEGRDPVYLVVKPHDARIAGEVHIRKPEMIPDVLAEMSLPMPSDIGLELQDLPYAEVMRLSKVFTGAKLADISGIMRTARMVKDATEIELIRDCGLRHVAAYARIPGLYSPGMSDVELQIEIERTLRQEGCLGYLRTSGRLMEINMGSVLNGDNASVPTPYDFALGGGGASLSLPVGACGRIMDRGTTVMIDMNGNFNGYQTDLTRTWAIGDVSAKALEIHALSVDICHALEHMALPGVPVASLYDTALQMARDKKCEHLFMGDREHAQFIGHGVGIQLNEWPVLMHRSPHLLEENMVLAIEPKFVLPGIGALGIENTYRVTSHGLENLTPAPESLDILPL